MRNNSRALAAVIGHPVGHSLSPAIFSFLAQKQDLPLLYTALDISPKKLKTALKAMKELSFLGCNITIPHKQAVLSHVMHRSPEVKLIGAANVIHHAGRGWKAYNTDFIGMILTLKSHNISIRGHSAVIFGTGGAARAAAAALGQLQAKNIWIYSRRPMQALRFCREFNTSFKKSKFHVLSHPVSGIQLWVNATPLGMMGFPKNLLLSQFYQREKSTHTNQKVIAFDLVYRPMETTFLKEASRLGLKTIGGLDLLIWQALATAAIWFPNHRIRSQKIQQKSAQLLHKYLREEVR